MKLTYSQCKQIASNGDLRDTIEALNNAPEWLDIDDLGTVRAVQRGGCSSGAYMPAVTYWQASKTMAEHGDDVLDYIQENYGELPSPPQDTSWSGLAVFYLSMAVELWCGQFYLWTNRETWLVNLWFGEHLTMMQEDGEEVSADYIETMVTEYVDEIVPTSSFIADMIDLQCINWDELAEHYRE